MLHHDHLNTHTYDDETIVGSDIGRSKKIKDKNVNTNEKKKTKHVHFYLTLEQRE